MESRNNIRITPSSILSPDPELLLSTAGPPSDSQATVLRSEIERAKHEISAASLHIAHLQDALTRLLRHRKEMETFVRAHNGILSTLRRFPNEILLEVFQQTLAESAAVNRWQMPWALSEVCSHWRRVMLASPPLWRHFPPLSDGDRPFSTLMMSLQVERARHIPVSINFGYSIPPHALTLLLPVVSQWEDVAMTVTSLMSPQLSSHTFSTLKKLTLSKSILPPAPTSSPLYINRIGSLPSLVHLTLHTRGYWGLPRHLLLPWSQLRICELHGVSWFDLLWILPKLNGSTLVAIIGSVMSAFQPTPTTSLVRSLTFTNCSPAFLIDVLSNLSMPALDTLILQNLGGPTRPPHSSIGSTLAFLERSACALQRLCIDTHVNEDELVQILESPHIHNAIDLDLPLAPLSPRSIAALANLPSLRTLAVCGIPADEVALLAALTAHHPHLFHSERSTGAAGELRFRFTFG
ncbi:hypothetical protein C8R46DRAFT_1272216 [Mycena filopes]|nr:hypothetical protein C8R46DRAFT_1272216 [Mycena filopes]